MTVHISTVGIIATEPRLISTPDGVSFCSFRLAVSERRYDRDQQSWADGATSWFSVAAFRSLGEHASASFHVGDRIIISGKLRTRQWEKDDRSGTSVDIEADAIGHELRWGTTTFQKSPPQIQSTFPGDDAGWASGPTADTDDTGERRKSA